MRSSFGFLVASCLALGLAATPAAAGIHAAEPGRVLTGEDAVLRRPADVVTKTLAPEQGCQALLDTGDGDCAVVEADGGPLVFTVEPLTERDPVLIERPWAVRVYAKSKTVPDGWDVVLENPEQQVRTFAQVTAKVADVSGHGSDDVVFGYRAAGTGQFLDYDVVVPDAQNGAVVAAHERLDKGVVVAKKGRIVAYYAFFRTQDANCCPKYIIRQTIKDRSGEFRVVAEKRLVTKKADIPPGDLG